MNIRRHVVVWYRLGRDVGGPWIGVRNAWAGFRRWARTGGRWPHDWRAGR